MSANYEVIYQSFGAIQNSDFRCLVYDSYIWSNSILLSYKKGKLNYKISNAVLILLLWVKVVFVKKCWHHKKYKRVIVLKGLFSETTYLFLLMYQIFFKINCWTHAIDNGNRKWIKFEHLGKASLHCKIGHFFHFSRNLRACELFFVIISLFSWKSFSFQKYNFFLVFACLSG